MKYDPEKILLEFLQKQTDWVQVIEIWKGCEKRVAYGSIGYFMKKLKAKGLAKSVVQEGKRKTIFWKSTKSITTTA